MINTTAVVKLNISESVLQGAVRRALSHASDALRKGYELVHVELASVSTKTNPVLGFSKFIELGVLKANTKFDSDFLQNAFACSQHNDTLPGEMFHRCFPYSSLDGIEYKRAYSGSVKKGIGLFLLSLHCAGAITLPVSFNWPSSRNSEKSGRAGRMVCEFSELMSFVRSVETVSGCSQDPAFKMLRTPKRAEWFSTYATKLLLATGWSKPEEANYQDLFKIFEAQNEAEGRLTSVSVFVTLAQILKLKFGSRIAADFGRPDVWKKMLGQHRSQKNFEKRAIEVLPFADTEDISGSLQIDGRTSDQVFSNLLRTAPAVGSPTKLKEALKKLPTDHPLIKNVGYWLDLQEIYFLRRKRENYNPVYIALGYLNLYLCYYLPAWFRENPSTQLAFPSTPDLLVGTVYISRVLSVNLPLPRTFMEYMNERSREALWEGNTYYAKLKQVEIFFNYIISNAHQLRNCLDFIQPFTKDDYPESTSRRSTNKTPMPRRLFPYFLAYVETVKLYVDQLTQKILDGDVTLRTLRELQGTNGRAVWCRAYAEIIPVPSLKIGEKEVTLTCIPSIFRFGWKSLIDGKVMLIPHPHVLNQIIVGLYTGLRHNHIQWLDASTFDRFADVSGCYTKLLVNTDKSMKKPWTPDVDVRVIKVLREQLKWRALIDEPLFKEKQFYNNNPATAYPKFLPLFASGSDGLPHGDSAYEGAWSDLIAGFQGILPQILDKDENEIPVLCKLRPIGIDFHDLYEREKLKPFSEESLGKVQLTVVTRITPHSARAGVVSDLIQHLPAGVIGKRITGQKESTVYHYVCIDPQDRMDQQAYQAMDMRSRALNRKMDEFVRAEPNTDESYIKADAVNSNLAKSMRVDLRETIARYGCVSLVSNEGESGIDFLQEEGIEQAAFNKTEICPYGNNCPAELIKRLKGFRRCALCPYAVRSIDHLPAICARKKSTVETLFALNEKLSVGLVQHTYTDTELQNLEEERIRVSEDIAGWELCEEVLEQARTRVENGEDSRRWTVEEPEILLQHLQRIDVPAEKSSYLISRLMECHAYPGYQNPNISKKFELLRRRILAKAGTSLEEVLSLDIPNNPAAECVGLIRSLAGAHNFTVDDLKNILNSDAHLEVLPRRNTLQVAYVAN